MGLSAPKVMIGELSSAPRMPGRFAVSENPVRGGISAHDFLGRVASEPLVTDGVAWHPYQHRDSPRLDGGRRVTGIGRIDHTQRLLSGLFDKGQACGAKRLRTPACDRPGLLYTEFGYRVRSDKRSEFHTEGVRRRWFVLTLRRALKNRAKWMTIYHATELNPTLFPESPTDYGLFESDGTTRGARSYGKQTRDPDDDDRRRVAFCDGIYAFTAARGYDVDRANSACGAL